MSFALIGLLSYSLALGSVDIPPPAGATPGFGRSLDASGPHLIIGTPSGNGGKGHVAIYDQADPSNPVWTLAVSSLSSDAGAGTAVAVDGDWAVIGIPGDNKAIILKYESDGPTPQWTEHEWLSPPPGVSEFGFSIDLNNDQMLIGAPGGDEAVGAFVLEDYTFPDGSTQLLWNNYGFIGTPLPPGSRWGHAVTIESSTGFVGSPQYNDGSGRLFSVHLTDGFIDIGSDLTYEIPWTNGQIGWDVVCRNGQLYVTAPAYGLNEASGIIWVLRFLEDDDGSFHWMLNNHITPPVDAMSSQYGYSVFTNGSRVGVGAPTADGKGAIFLYNCSLDDPDFPNFPYLGKFSPDSLTNDAGYGTDFFIGSTNVIASAPGSDAHGPDHGRVLIVDLDTIEAPVNQQVPYDNSNLLDAFEGLAPSSITGSGSRVVLGAPYANDGDGLVQLVDNHNGSWDLDGLLGLDPGSSPNLFGHDVSQHEDILAVGAPGVSGAGSVYLYQETGDGYQFLSKILPPRIANIAFGYSVDVFKAENGYIFVAIGSPGVSMATGEVNDPGSCYLYMAEPDDYTSWSMLLNRVSTETKSLLGLDVEIELMESGLVMAASEPSFLLNKGSVWMYSGGVSQESWVQLPSIEGEVSGSNFGYSIGLKGRYLVCGAPGSTVNAPEGAVYSLALIDGSLDEWHVMTPGPGDTVGTFGKSVAITQDDEHYRIAVGITGFQGGPDNSPAWTGSAVDLFAGQIFESGSVNSMNYHCRVVNADISDGLGSSVAFSDSKLFMINSREDAQSMGPVTKAAASFDLANKSYWIAADGGDVKKADNWSIEPQNGDTLVFSLLGTTRYLVDIAGIVNAHIEFLYDQAILISDEESVDKVKSIAISSDASIESASIILGGGLLEVEEAVRIGGTNQNMGGSLYLAVNGRLNCDTLSQTSTGQMGYGISSLTTDSQWIVDAENVEIKGSLRVQILAGLAETLAIDDTFHFIRSVSVPPESQNRFEVIVLPALPNGLAFIPRYTQDTMRSGPAGWTMSLVVVSVDDLLAFNDPSSVVVDDNAIAIEVADLTGDGAEEICLIFDGTPGSLIIFENDGAGGIAQQVIVNTGDSPVDITSGDFDGDGTIDLAVANSADQNVTVYYNEDSDITNGFTTVDVSIARTPTCLAGINYNFDSLKDLVIGVTDDDGDGNGDWLFYEATVAMRAGGFNNGGNIASNGTPLGVDPSEEEDQKDIPFSGRKSNGKADVARFVGIANHVPVLEIVEYTVGADPAGLANVDLNGDGLVDVAVTSRTNGTIALLIQDPTSPGDFLGPTYVPIGIEPMDMTAVDFNLDGNNDLAAITTDDDGFQVVRILQNNGGLTFTSIDVGKGEFPILVDAGDIDGNGDKELVTIGDSGALRSGDGEPLMSVREVESTCNCIGDANCDEAVNIDDLLGVLAEFGCDTGCGFDINQDGVTNIDDLLIVISSWGPCR